MKYAPDTLVAADYPAASKPTLGGEKEVFVSLNPASLDLGSVEVTAVNSGVWTADTVNSLPAEGMHLVAVLETRAGMNGGGGNVVFTVTGTDVNDAPITGVATFAIPAYAELDAKIWQVGFAADVIQAADKKFKTITTVAPTTAAAEAKYSVVSIFGMPDPSTFVTVGCITDFNFKTKSAVPVAIACGMDGARFTKPGRTERPTLEVTGKLVSLGDGLSRLDGYRCTMKIEVRKDGRVISDRLYFLGTIGQTEPSLPDGEGEATLRFNAVYEDCLIMPAL